MVKVLQAFNFTKQYTYALNTEILAATLIDSNRIAICGSEQFIEIYDISGEDRINLDQRSSNENAVDVNGARIPTKYSLGTVGEVVNLIYCESGNYLLTLEKENISSPVHGNHVSSISCTSSGNTSNKCNEDEEKMFVRVYANFWKFPESKLIDLPITIRIASMTTPKAPIVESIDVIELLLRSPPDLMQCCQASGNIIVSSKERIYLFEHTQCVHESTQPRFSYIDFLPFKFFISLNFVPSKFCLTENVIACLNHQYCVAFKVVDVLGSTDSAGCENAPDTAADISNSESSNDGKRNGCAGFSRNSFELDSLETSSSTRPVAYPGRTPIDFNVARMINSACGRDFEVELKSQSDDENDNCENLSLDEKQRNMMAYPLRNSDIKIKLINEAKAMNVQRLMQQERDDDTVQYDIRRLLQIGLRCNEPTSRHLDEFRCIDLRPIYQRNDNNDPADQMPIYEAGNEQVPGAVSSLKHAHRRTLKSNQHHNCIAYALLVASTVDGYLYQFCAQGKWYNENEKPIAVYAFTAPVIHVKLNDSWIYAITTESVETHTSRMGHKLFHNRFEYPMLIEQFAKEASPDVNAPVSMIGLASFMQVQHVCVGRNNLILISNSSLKQRYSLHKRYSNNNGNSNQSGSNDENKRSIAARLFAETRVKRLLRSSSETPQTLMNEWTLYNLELPSIRNVVEDLEAIADSYCAESNVNFFDIMEEAHVMLRLSLSLQQPTDKDMFREQHLRALFKENCRKLADFSIRSNKREIYIQAIGFCKLCQLHLLDVYKRQVSLLQQDFVELEQVEDAQASERGKQLIGFMHTIKTMLMELGSDRQHAALLHHQVQPYFTPMRAIEHGYSNVSLSLELLNVFVRYSRKDIPQIMLHSPVVADSIGSELINYLRFIEPLDPDENLLLAVTACRLSNYTLAQEVVTKTERQELGQALMRNKNVLFDDGTLLFQHAYDDVPATSGVAAGKTTTINDLTRHCDTNYKAHYQPPECKIDGKFVVFSEFTENILFETEQQNLIEALCDVFIHALCIEHSISADIIIQLFLNYMATHIGQKGYQTSQKILTMTLQVYYHDLYDVMSLSSTEQQSCTPPLLGDLDDYFDIDCIAHKCEYDDVSNELDNKQQSDLEACSNSTDATSCTIGQVYANSNGYDRLFYNNKREHLEAAVALTQTNDRALHLKGFKLLFRLYLSRLQALTDQLQADPPVEMPDTNKLDLSLLRRESIKYLQQHLQELREKQQSEHAYYYANGDLCGRNNNKRNKIFYAPYIPDYTLSREEFDAFIKTYQRPIPCLMDRPKFLNLLPPFQRNDFSFINVDKGETSVRFLGWQNELLTQVLKLQALFSYNKISRCIIEEFLSYIQKSINLTGIDSFLVIILPNNLAINYMLNFSPQHLWHYGKSLTFTPKHWENLLRKLMRKKTLLNNWESTISEVLYHLINEYSFEDLLKCYPSEVLQSKKVELLLKEVNDYRVSLNMKTLQIVCRQPDDKSNGQLSRNHLPMDNIDETNLFETSLRSAVAKQRSIALRTMIESTGNQLFDATNNPIYKL